jgi:hypothetical protein
MVSYRVGTIQQRGEVPNYEASVAKLFHSELSQRLASVGLGVGMFGNVRKGGPTLDEAAWPVHDDLHEHGSCNDRRGQQ